MKLLVPLKKTSVIGYALALGLLLIIGIASINATGTKVGVMLKRVPKPAAKAPGAAAAPQLPQSAPQPSSRDL